MKSGVAHFDIGAPADNLLALKVEGRIAGDAIDELVERLKAIAAKGKKARLYVDLTSYEGYERSVVKEKLAHFGTLWGSIERVAYVVDIAWMTSAIHLVDAVTPIHIRAFSSDKAKEARAWLLEDPA
jgi:hypothetical protein